METIGNPSVRPWHEKPQTHLGLVSQIQVSFTAEKGKQAQQIRQDTEGHSENPSGGSRIGNDDLH